MKKIALPTRNGNIDDHFGHCAFYTIITVNDNNEVAKTEIMQVEHCIPASGRRCDTYACRQYGYGCPQQTVVLRNQSSERLQRSSDGCS